MFVVGIIPARYKSTRFPGKPLAEISGKTMIQRVYEQAKKCSLLSKIIVATDDKEIFEHVITFGGEAVMTRESHTSGTERCNEVAKKKYPSADIIINIQGDQPYIDPDQISTLIKLFNNTEVSIGTLAKKIDTIEDMQNPNCVKVIFNAQNRAVNFCRKVKNLEEEESYYKHIGIYGYKIKTLTEICNLEKSKNEIKEQLEQLRWIDNNYTINVGITTIDSVSVDTLEDILNIRSNLR